MAVISRKQKLIRERGRLKGCFQTFGERCKHFCLFVDISLLFVTNKNENCLACDAINITLNKAG